jgi:hypothetical protein
MDMVPTALAFRCHQTDFFRLGDQALSQRGQLMALRLQKRLVVQKCRNFDDDCVQLSRVASQDQEVIEAKLLFVFAPLRHKRVNVVD